MSQTKRGSALESFANIVAGFALNYIVNVTGFRLMGYRVSGESVFVMSVVMTILSFIRSYTIRRWFNRSPL